MKKHPIFPVELFTFESSPELVEETLDALDPIERGNFNLPNTVQTTQGNLHCLPQFKNTFEWIDQCLDEVKKDQQFDMWGKFEEMKDDMQNSEMYMPIFVGLYKSFPANLHHLYL